MNKKRKRKDHMHDTWGHGTDHYDHNQVDHYNYNQPINTYKAKKGWDTGDAPKVCTDCSYLSTTQKQKILMNYDVWKTLMAICGTVKVEWQALLTGSVDAEGIVHITGYFIPKQEVTGTSVKNLDLIDDVVIQERSIVAGVHSHANMACFFSSTDDECTNMSLIRHNIVVNNDGKYKAQSRVDLPCGLVKFVNAEVFTVGEPSISVVGLENIKERVYVPNTQYNWTPSESLTVADNNKLDGIRWCPVCEGCPEEDGGNTCLCWTKGKRHMLPDFSVDNYVLQHGRSYELKPNLLLKYITKG